MSASEPMSLNDLLARQRQMAWALWVGAAVAAAVIFMFRNTLIRWSQGTTGGMFGGGGDWPISSYYCANGVLFAVYVMLAGRLAGMRWPRSGAFVLPALYGVSWGIWIIRFALHVFDWTSSWGSGDYLFLGRADPGVSFGITALASSGGAAILMAAATRSLRVLGLAMVVTVLAAWASGTRSMMADEGHPFTIAVWHVLMAAIMARWAFVAGTLEIIGRYDASRCPRCGYALSGLRERACPECGWRDETADAKNALRTKMKAALAQMTPDAAAEESARIESALAAWPVWRNAATVMVYAPMKGEADVSGLARRALAEGKRVCIPRVDWQAGTMEAVGIQSWEQDLQSGKRGVMQPRPGLESVAPGQIEAVLVPGLAFDEEGGRLGRGAGYYDRFMAGLGEQATTVGVALSAQVVDRVPMGPGDVRVRALATAQGVRELVPPPGE